VEYSRYTIYNIEEEEVVLSCALRKYLRWISGYKNYTLTFVFPCFLYSYVRTLFFYKMNTSSAAEQSCWSSRQRAQNDDVRYSGTTTHHFPSSLWSYVVLLLMMMMMKINGRNVSYACIYRRASFPFMIAIIYDCTTSHSWQINHNFSCIV
jgi:hypothetical protein